MINQPTTDQQDQAIIDLIKRADQLARWHAIQEQRRARRIARSDWSLQ